MAQVQKQSDYACVQAEIATEQAKGGHTHPVSLQERLRQYKLNRLQRTRNFISHVNAKRDKFFDDLYGGESGTHLRPCGAVTTF